MEERKKVKRLKGGVEREGVCWAKEAGIVLER